MASNRDRIQRMALEAELTAKEKAEMPKKKASTAKTKTKAKTTTRKTSTTKTSGRVKKIWKVFDPALKEKAAFPYPKEAEAQAKAKELSKKTGKDHIVRGIEVPLEEEI